MAEIVDPEMFKKHALIYPTPSQLRKTAAHVAKAVVREASKARYGRIMKEEEIDDAVEKEMWYPEYVEYLAPAEAIPKL